MEWFIYMLVAAVMTGCFTSFMVVLLRKLGILEILQVNGDLWFAKLIRWKKWLKDYYENNNPQPNLIYKLASCDFCLNWWLAWAFALPLGLLTGDVWWFGVPWFSTTIGRWLSS